MPQPSKTKKTNKRKDRATPSTSSVDSNSEQSPTSTKMPDPKKSRQGQTTLQDTFVKTTPSDATQGKVSLEAKIDHICKSMVTEESLTEHLKPLITTEQLNIAIVTLKTDLLKEVNAVIESKLEEVHGNLHDLSVENKNLKESVKSLSQKLERQAYNAQAALSKAKNTEIKVNELEQYGRKSSIRIFGLNDTNPAETALETAEEVTRLLNSQLHMDVKPTDIDIAHRLARFEQGKPRPVIVKFMRRHHKIESIQKRRALKGTRIVIREDLTPINQKLLKETITLDNVDNAWTKDGVIFAKHRISGNIIRVTHFDDLATKFL